MRRRRFALRLAARPVARLAARLARRFAPSLVILTLACRDEIVAPRQRAASPPRLTTSASSPPAYFVPIDLGTLGGNVSKASDINDAGLVVGTASTATGYDHAFLYTPGVGMQDLGTLGGLLSHATGINDAGHVVGTSMTATGGSHAFLWTPAAGMQDLGTLPGSVFSQAEDINESDQVVGYTGTEAFLYTPGQGMQSLGGVPSPVGVTAKAFGINDSGEIVGESGGRAVRFVPGSTPQDIPVFTPSGYSDAAAINNAGQIVGWWYTAGSVPVLFLYTPGSGAQDGATLIFGRETADLNDAGDYVGTTDWVFPEAGFFTPTTGPSRFLPGIGYSTASTFATAVNNGRQVAGWAVDPVTRFPHATLWEPTNDPPPVIVVSVPSGGVESAALAFDATQSFDPNGGSITFDWDFGDGTPHGAGAAPNHTYADDGVYTVTLTASDGTNFPTATRSVMVADAPPAPSAGPDQTRVVGRALLVTPSFTDAGLGDAPWIYSVSWGDGSMVAGRLTLAQGTQPSLSHTYAAAGTYTVTLTVTDKDGGAAADLAKITVVPNSPPVASANGPYAGSEGTAVCFSSSGTSDANGDPLSFAWAFGDGGKSSVASPCRVYQDDGTYAVTLTVKDPSGATSTATATATIANVAPSASFMAPATVTEGVAQTLTLANGTDKGATDKLSLEYAFECGTGAGPTPWSTTLKSVVCPAFADQQGAPVTLTGRIRDKDGAIATYAKSLAVTNAPPAPALGATTPTTLARGGSLGVDGRFTDKGAADGPWSWKIAWGDGTPATTGTSATQNVPLPASHVYTKAGSYLAKLTVTDKDARSATSAAVAVTVTP